MNKEREELESVWGFYGDPDTSGCIDEAKAVVTAHVKDSIKKHLQQLKQWIINKVPLIYRKPLILQ